MGIEGLQLLIKNKLRQYIRIYKKNKLKWTLAIFMGVFLIFSMVDLIRTAIDNYFSILSLGFFIYCTAKIFQDIPIMNIDCKLIKFKVLRLWQLKTIIILKSVILSGVIFTFVLNFSNMLDRSEFYRAVLLVLINIVINFVCFFKSQTNNANVLTIFTLLVVSLSYYINSILIISIYLFTILYVFINKKYFKYDQLLPYYQSMAFLYEGLVNNDISTLSQGQMQLTKQKLKSSFNFMEKYYGNEYRFEFYKEISRAIYNYKRIVNVSLINFLITLLTLMYEHPIWINSVAMFSLVFITDSVLTLINKPEAINKNKGFYFPYSLKEIIKQKYFAHLCVILIPFISSLLILKYISFFVVIICFFILPIKNILYNFGEKFITKCFVYCLESIILLMCTINLL
ncbi:hypothetical protein [Alkalithermobacter paradoxus]|uniref:Bacterial ABC transporter protein EcsB n=1 Tax=Alkalithermobacter paradoxus TaxID=29349 RepID=A0A1V4I8J5_9FIRM|nr:hypothetical protein CLOTH_10450 [[Clostridium] thermoalcaliphilum]